MIKYTALELKISTRSKGQLFPLSVKVWFETEYLHKTRMLKQLLLQATSINVT